MYLTGQKDFKTFQGETFGDSSHKFPQWIMVGEGIKLNSVTFTSAPCFLNPVVSLWGMQHYMKSVIQGGFCVLEDSSPPL